MLSRDLRATVIKTFFEELEDVREGGFGHLYVSYFGRDRDWFLQADVKEITTFLIDDPLYKIEMLTELLYRDARTLTDVEIQGILYRKIIELYDKIDTCSTDFSLERMNRKAELERYLL